MSSPNPKADEYLWDYKHGEQEDFSTCEVCNLEFYADEAGSKRCSECEYEYGLILWPDQI